MKRDRIDELTKELDGGKKGLLGTLRKHSRPILAGLGLMTLLGFGGMAAKKGAEKVESVRLERVIDRAAQAESLSKMPKSYTNQFQALDDVIVLRKAWRMISNPYSIDRYANDFVKAKQNYENLSEKDQHDCDLLGRAIGLTVTEMKQLPSEQYSESRSRALVGLKKDFEARFKCAQNGHGLLKGISPKAFGGVQCGALQYEVGLEVNSPYVFESRVLSDSYRYETQAEREQYLSRIRQQVVQDNPAGHAQTPRTGGRG